MSELRKIIFVPGFVRNPESVKLIEQRVAEIQPVFQDNGWEIVLSKYYDGKPSVDPISKYAKIVAEEIEEIQPDAIIAHSMGTLIVRGSWKYYKDFRGPIVFIEGPNMGVAWWKLLITGFPLWRVCVRDMMPRSPFMKSLENIWAWPPHQNFVLEIQGKFSRHPLAGNVFEPLFYSRIILFFPEVGHRELVTDSRTIKSVLELIKSYPFD